MRRLFAALLVSLAVQAPAAPSGATVLWEQSTLFGSHLSSQYYTDNGYGVYVADDFFNAGTWSVDALSIAGAGGNLAQAASLTWAVYADADGVPAGYPGTGQEYWIFTCAPGASGVTLTASGQDVRLDLVSAGTALTLPPGSWWLVFYPTMASGTGLWDWYAAQTVYGAQGKLIDPSNHFGSGWTSWVNWTVTAPITETDLAFRIEGEPVTRVSGKVRHESGAPFRGVRVRLYAADGTTLLASTRTNSSGAYTFAGLLPGGYTLKPNQSGWRFRPSKREIWPIGTDLTGKKFQAYPR